MWAAALTLGLAGLALAVRGRWRSLVVAGAVVMLGLLGWVRTERIIERTWDDSGDASAVEELRDGVLADGVDVDVDFSLPPGSTSTSRMMLYQFHLPRTEFTVVNDPVDGATSPYVFARL